MFKFTMMRVRAKIGYHAFQKRMTINELICSQILSSYNTLTRNGHIPPIAPYPKELISKFDELVNSPQFQIVEFMMDLSRHPVVN